ncbi:hypothetical protein KSP40_PGU002094 [Platanthera guangdongensis]|uniref:Uncharacterized protein n=1 Tax=Platanthera guangdongensis TaxID=2320717 RepID=A0ABR2MNN7_9ASPA
MLAVGIGESKGSELFLEDNWVNPIKEVDNLVYNLFQVERGGFSLTRPDDEAIEVDHLLVEQHFVGTFDDDVMYMSSKSFQECSNVSDIPCSTDYHDQEGILNADAKQTGKHALKYEFMLEGAEENEDFHATCNLSCDCSDFLLESVSAENLLLDYQSNGESTVTNMKCARQIQCIDEAKSVLPYIAKTFALCNMDQTTVPLNSTNGHERHNTLQSTACRNASLEDQKWLKHELLFDQQVLTGLGGVSDLMGGALLSSENEDMILVTGNEMSERVFSSLLSIPHNGGLLTGTDKNEVSHGVGQAALIEDNQGTHEILEDTTDSFMATKRLRKPTRRYIEETSESKSRRSYDRFKNALLTSKERVLQARTEMNYPSGVTMQSLGARQRRSTKQLGVDGNQYVLPLKTTSTFYDSELQDEASDESTTSNCSRRKHHRQWMLSEVVKLVDGVSHYGVGRWTEIKRLLFSSSAHRTAVDLKDKWRNLLRASFADSENCNLAEAHQRKHGSANIPRSILERVRELSFIYPYPRSQRKLRIADAPRTPTPTPRRRRNSGAPAHLRSRILPARSFSQ